MQDELMIPKSVLCDIDGVLGNLTLPIILSMNKEFGTEYKAEDWNNWNWPIEQVVTQSGMDIGAAAQWVFSLQHLKSAIAIPEAQQVLKFWSEQGTQIHVATSRSTDSSTVTKDWLTENFPFINPKDINIRGDASIKGNAYKALQAERLKPDMYFEDEAAAVMELLKVWPQNLLAIIRLINQPWNKDAGELDPYRVSWNDFEKQIPSMTATNETLKPTQKSDD